MDNNYWETYKCLKIYSTNYRFYVNLLMLCKACSLLYFKLMNIFSKLLRQDGVSLPLYRDLVLSKNVINKWIDINKYNKNHH